MGAKFSNFSTNSKNLQNISSPLCEDYLNDERNINPSLYSSEIPSIVVDYDNSEKCIDINSEQPPYTQCEPHLFPKITMATQSVPVTNANWFRIHPIKQKGVKLSDTHYWIINEPKHKRCHSARVKRNPPEMYVNAKTIGNEPYEEPDLPYDLNEQISQEYIRTRPIKRGQSENNKEYLSNMHRGLVVRMMLQIASATEMECNSVLIGANWDFEVAEKRLKVDMLHRKGLVNQQRCTNLLERHNWNLNQAAQQAEKEFKQMQFERQQSSNSSRSHHSEET